ncbi:DUF1559 domain-containing protein [bacterium]|nr:MAG: DUF1559 domain-containing protein [bacterium]
MRPFQNSTPRFGRFNVLRELVGVAVILVLVAVLYPPFARARDNARRSNCQGNLKRLSLSVLQYCRDYDENYPHAVKALSLASARRVPTGWADALLPYFKDANLLICPSGEAEVSTDPHKVGYTSYWYNGALSWNGQTGKKARWSSNVAIVKVLHPERTVMFGDAGITNGSGTARTRCNGFDCQGNDDITSPSAAAPKNNKVSGRGFAGGGLRHLKGLNIAFADGHVKWFPSVGPDRSGVITNINTPFSVSQLAPTFNAVKE